MISFLKRFIWPSRISQESIGAALCEQRIEIEGIRRQVSDALRIIHELQTEEVKSQSHIDKRLADLTDVTGALQVQLFDYEFRQSECLQSLKKAVEVNFQSKSEIKTHNSELLERIYTIVVSEKEQNQLMSGFVFDLQAVQGQIEELKTKVQEVRDMSEKGSDLSRWLDPVFSRLDEVTRAIQNKSDENRNLTIHEVTTAHSDIDAVKNKLLEVQVQLQSGIFDPIFSRLDEATLAIQNRSDENRNLTIHEVTTVHSDIDAIKNKVAELKSHLEEKVKNAATFDLNPVLLGVSRAVQDAQQSLHNASFEGRNILMHEITTQQSGIEEIKNIVFKLSNALHSVDLKIVNESVRQSGEIVGAIAGLTGRPQLGSEIIVPQPTDLTFEKALEHAKKDDPKLFDLWYERLLEIKDAFENDGKHGNAANAADPYSMAFKSFVEAHARGSILDVGCGVHGKPHYLSAYPDAQIAGLDPLDAIEPVNFIRRTGIGEYLPWKDNSFETLISATAIDHVLSLDKSFEEMLRVMKPGGQVLMWVGSVAGSKKFTPKAEDFEPADSFHLFHIDKAWFEPELEKYFKIGAQVSLWLPQHEHLFYQLLEK